MVTNSKEYMRKYREFYFKEEKNVLKQRNAVKEWSIKNKQKRRENAKKYREKNQEKEIAHRISLKIPLKNKCDICGTKDKLERHHWRYDRPLLVNTLCKFCHTIQHNPSRIGGNYIG